MTTREPSERERLLTAIWANNMPGRYVNDAWAPTFDPNRMQVPVDHSFTGSVAPTAQNVGTNFAATGGAVPTTNLNVGTNFAVTGGAAPTTIRSAGIKIAVTGTNVSAGASFTANPDPPVTPALHVVRYYSQKKFPAPGSADTPDIADAPSTPGKEDATYTDTVTEVLVPVGEEQVTVQVTDEDAVQTKVRVRRYNRRSARETVLSPARMTRIAVSIVGQKRREVGYEWQSHLFGEPGRGLSRRDQVRAARGFVWSAVRFRLQDAADLAWRPVDAMLGSRTLSNLLVWGPVFVVLLAIVRHDGRYGLVADIQDPIALGLFLCAAIKVGRRYRGIELPKHKPRRARE
jgi:hypothetical protein